MHVYRHANQAAGQGPLELVPASQVGRVRAAVAHGHAKALGVAQHDVGIPFTRRREQGKCQQVGSHAQRCAITMGLTSQGPQIINMACGCRVLSQYAEVIALGH